MSRYDLTDFEWRVIQPMLPSKPRGVPRVDDRRVLNGIRRDYPALTVFEQAPDWLRAEEETRLPHSTEPFWSDWLAKLPR